MDAKSSSTPEPLEKPSRIIDRSKPKKSRSAIVLVAYVLSTFLYSIAIRPQPSTNLAVIPFAIMAFFIPDYMVIKLLSNPFTLMERVLLFWVGPFPLAFMLCGLMRTT